MKKLANVEYDCPFEWADWFKNKAFSFGSARLKLNPDQSVDVHTEHPNSTIGFYSFDASLDYTDFPFHFGVCYASFCCANLLLKDLAKTPRIVHGDFNANKLRNVTSLINGPLHVHGDYCVTRCKGLRTRIDGTLRCNSLADIEPETLKVLLANKTRIKTNKRSRLSTALNAYCESQDLLALIAVLLTIPRLKTFAETLMVAEPIPCEDFTL